MRSMKIRIVAILLAIVALGAACSGGGSKDNEKSDAKSRDKTVNELISEQPAETMDYSPSRNTINKWITTWGEPGKLSYVYLVNTNGDTVGYYILEGLPVSYCASITRNYDVRNGSGDTELVLPAPGVDGVWYSGGQCQTYYGFDAESGQYLEWFAGMGLAQLVYSEPLERLSIDAQPLGDATFDSVGAD